MTASLLNSPELFYVSYLRTQFFFNLQFIKPPTSETVLRILTTIIYFFRVFYISVSWRFFTGVQVTASLLNSPELFYVSYLRTQFFFNLQFIKPPTSETVLRILTTIIYFFRVFYISVSWRFFTGVQVTASLLNSPELFYVSYLRTQFFFNLQFIKPPTSETVLRILTTIIYFFRVFYISVSWRFFTGVQVTASLLNSPELFYVSYLRTQFFFNLQFIKPPTSETVLRILTTIIYFFRVFYISVSWRFFTGVQVTASLLNSPELFYVSYLRTQFFFNLQFIKPPTSETVLRILTTIIYSFRVFLHQRQLTVLHWSSSDSKSPQFSRTLLCILSTNSILL